MGGSINMAFRFSDGEACCFDRWTNNMGNLSKLEILDGDEQPVRDYIAMCRNNDYLADPDFTGKPVRVSTSGYGLVLIDYVTKTIIDCNGYSSLFGAIHGFQIREGGEDEWMARHYNLIKRALETGRGVIEARYNDKDRDAEAVRTRLTGLDALPEIVKKAKRDRSFLKSKYYYVYSIDTAPWSYNLSMGDYPSERKQALKIARDIGFPMTRKEGLNKNYPYPSSKKIPFVERKARYLWIKMKELDSYKEFDGHPWEKLSDESKASILDMASVMTAEEFDELRFQDYLGATSLKIMISA